MMSDTDNNNLSLSVAKTRTISECHVTLMLLTCLHSSFRGCRYSVLPQYWTSLKNCCPNTKTWESGVHVEKYQSYP